jgi:hypothetical protein
VAGVFRFHAEITRPLPGWFRPAAPAGFVLPPVEPSGIVVKPWAAPDVVLQGYEQDDVHPEFQDRPHRHRPSQILPCLSVIPLAG